MRPITRRALFQSTAAAAAARLQAATYTGPVALQLYTLRSISGKDVEGTLRRVAAIGYQEVELAGFFDKNQKEVRALLDGVGLKAPSAHYSLAEVRTRWSEMMDGAQEIGLEYMIVSSLPKEERTSLDQYKKIGELFNKTGEETKKRGMQFGYHNHNFEFEPYGGKPAYDELLRSTDPKLVAMEMDVYWVTRANHDPFEYFRRFPGRFHLLHLKDKKKDSNDFLEVGQGDIDWAGVFKNAKRAGVRHFIVEQDQTKRDPLESIEMSYKYIRGLKY